MSAALYIVGIKNISTAIQILNFAHFYAPFDVSQSLTKYDAVDKNGHL